MILELGEVESWSFQGRASGVHQINANSGLALVLSLELLSKRPRAHKGQLLPTWDTPMSKSCPRNTAVLAKASSGHKSAFSDARG